MRIGLLSDVHANLPALDAVLDDLPDVDRIVCTGDVVGYNAWPAECLERVRAVSAVVVQGNHDRTVPTPSQYRANRMAEAGLELARETLSDEQRRWLADLPRRTDIADGRYRLVHSHPDPDQLGTYVEPDEFPTMRPYLDEYDGLVLGHTHVQHAAEVDGRTIVNPGSVGQPRDGDHRAAYAVLDTADGSVDLRRVDYDVVRAQQAIHERDLPQRSAYRLADGA